VFVVMGTMAVKMPVRGIKAPALTINGVKVVELLYTDVGELKVFAVVKDSSGATIAEIGDSGEWQINQAKVRGYRSNSHLRLVGAHGEELFWFKFLNPHTVQLRGRFWAPGYRGSVVITEDNVALEDSVNFHMGSGCSSQSGGVRFNGGRFQL